jgi:exosortase C (VPDSG-CTERM-specific)
MKKNDGVIAAGAPIAVAEQPPVSRALWWTVLAIVAIFSSSLYALATFALENDLYSYILLIPAISGYVLWLTRKTVHSGGQPNRRLAFVFFCIGAAGLVTDLSVRFSGAEVPTTDRLAVTTIAFVAALIGGCAWFLGPAALRVLSFPLGFLIFLTPLPMRWQSAIETFMQYGSATVAQLLFEVAGTAVFHEGLMFQLPGIALHVAPECSGIRSTLVLLVVSVITGYFFLRSPTRRVLLALIIVPLALARNGFRIFVIGELCVHIGPQMIDSPIHHKGGPIFFALSLIPLFFILILLQRGDRRTAANTRP